MNIRISRAKQNFGGMLDECYSYMTVENFAVSIRSLVENKEATWEELGFTDNNVADRLHKAQVRDAQRKFEGILNERHSFMTVEDFAIGIRALVQNNEATWSELGFTDNDVADRLHKAKVR